MDPTFDPYHKWLAIPKEKQPPDHYHLLGIPLFESDPDVICNAADQRLAHVRTFQTGEHQKLSQKILNEISKARICLLNPQKKADYDATLRERPAEKRSLPPQLPVAAAAASPQSLPQLDLSTEAEDRRFAARMPLWLPAAIVGVGGGALCCWLLFPLLVGQRDRLAAGPTVPPAVQDEAEPFKPPEGAELSKQEEPREAEQENERLDDEQPEPTAPEEPDETGEANHQVDDEGPELRAREEPREMEDDADQPDDEGPELTAREEPSQPADPQPPPVPEEGPLPLPEEPEAQDELGEPPAPGPEAAEPEPPAPERPSEELPHIRRTLPALYNLAYVGTQDVDMADRLISDFERGDRSVICLPYDNVTVYSRYDRYRRPDGLTVGFYADDTPMSYLVYERGDRQGTVRTWEPNGDLKYCGQYHRGDRRGFCCLFEDGELRLAVEYGSKEVEAIHLILGDRVLASFDGKDQAKEDARAAGPLEALEGLEDELKANEIQFKKDLGDAVDKFRRGLAGGLSEIKRRSIAQRANFRRAMANAGAQAVRRESTVPKTTRIPFRP